MSDESSALVLDAGGVTTLGPAVTHWAWSPDDAYLAVALADLDDAGRSALVVLDASGRAVMRIAGRSVEGLGWASAEHLVVTRAQDLGTRAILHAVPDGAVLGSVALPSLHGGRHRVMVPAVRGGVAPLVAVAPWRWHGGASQRVRHRAAYVLRVEPFEVAREVTPTTWTALPSLPHARPMVAAMEPDGERLVFWLGEPDAKGEVGAAPGHVVRYEWSLDRAAVVCRAGLRGVELLLCDPTRLALREATGDEAAARGDLAIVDTQRAQALLTTYDEIDTVGPWATMDLHPDGDRVLVAGLATLRVFDVAAGLATGNPMPVRYASSAVWRGDGDGLWLLLARGATGSVVGAEGLPRSGWRATPARSFTLGGKKPSQPRIAWSPLRTRLTVAWRCAPARGDAAAKALGVTRLAWMRA